MTPCFTLESIREKAMQEHTAERLYLYWDIDKFCGWAANPSDFRRRYPQAGRKYAPLRVCHHDTAAPDGYVKVRGTMANDPVTKRAF